MFNKKRDIPRVEVFREYLRDDQNDEQAEEKSGAGEIAPVECHRDGVAAGFTECCRGDLDNPEDKRDFGDLAEDRLFPRLLHFHCLPSLRISSAMSFSRYLRAAFAVRQTLVSKTPRQPAKRTPPAANGAMTWSFMRRAATPTTMSTATARNSSSRNKPTISRQDVRSRFIRRPPA
jgi:hypothetical protein